jgi:hypothetical protein
MKRRRVLGLVGTVLAACGEMPAASEGAAAAGAGTATLTPWRMVSGGFITPPTPPGALPRPSGMFTRLVAPAAVALRGADLLVADLGTQRVWRLNVDFQHATTIAGAPATPQTVLAIGGDLSAWVLDAGARQVLRFARDGRLVQTYRIGTALALPAGFALADGGATLVTADGGAAQWSEQRSPGGVVTEVLPRLADGRRVAGVDAIALAGRELMVLDRAGGAVHRVARDGRVAATLGRGELAQPSALAVDRDGRAFVVDRLGSELVMLSPDGNIERWGATQLGVQRIGGIAVDEGTLALSDAAMGQVALLRIRSAAR